LLKRELNIMANGDTTMFHIQLFIALAIVFVFWFFIIRAIVRHHRAVVARRPKPTAAQLAKSAERQKANEAREKKRKYDKAMYDLDMTLSAALDSFDMTDFCINIEPPLDVIFGKGCSAVPLSNRTIDLNIPDGDKKEKVYTIEIDGHRDVLLDGTDASTAEYFVDYINNY